MPAEILVTVDDREIRTKLNTMRILLRNLGPFYRNVGEEMVSETRHVIFPAQRDPATGTPWPKLKGSTVWGKARSKRSFTGARRILRRSGMLQDTIRYQADGSGVRWGTDRIYGPIHYFGGKTKPHVIKPRNKKALSWPGAAHPFKSVRHPGSKIPSRRFLGVGPRQRTRILEIAEDYLRRAA